MLLSEDFCAHIRRQMALLEGLSFQTFAQKAHAHLWFWMLCSFSRCLPLLHGVAIYNLACVAYLCDHSCRLPVCRQETLMHTLKERGLSRVEATSMWATLLAGLFAQCCPFFHACERNNICAEKDSRW